MAFNDNTVVIVSTSILVLAFLSLPSTVTSADCGGKPFHCENSTHFKICVDFGYGVSTTVDNFVIPCPSGTECSGNNHFECEPASLPPALPTPAATPSLSGVPTDSKSIDERSLPTSIWEVVTTNFPAGSSHDKEFSEKYLVTEEHLTLADNKSAATITPDESIPVMATTSVTITTETELLPNSEVNKTSFSDNFIKEITTEKTFESVLSSDDVSESTSSQVDITTTVSSNTIEEVIVTTVNTEQTTTDTLVSTVSTPSEVVTSTSQDITDISLLNTDYKVDILENIELFTKSEPDVTESQKSSTQYDVINASSTSWETPYTAVTTDNSVSEDLTPDRLNDMNTVSWNNIETTTTDYMDNNLWKTTTSETAIDDINAEREANNSIFFIIIPDEYDTTALDVENNNASVNAIGLEVAMNYGLTFELEQSNVNEAMESNNTFSINNNNNLSNINHIDYKIDTTTFAQDTTGLNEGDTTSTFATTTATVSDEPITAPVDHNEDLNKPSTTLNDIYGNTNTIPTVTVSSKVPTDTFSVKLIVDENLPTNIYSDKTVDLKPKLPNNKLEIVNDTALNNPNTSSNSSISESEKKYHFVIIGLGINPFFHMLRKNSSVDMQQSSESVKTPLGGTNSDNDMNYYSGSVTKPLSGNDTYSPSSNLQEIINKVSETQDTLSETTTKYQTGDTLRSNQTPKNGEDKHFNQLLNKIVLNVIPDTNTKIIINRTETRSQENTTKESVNYTVRQQNHTIMSPIDYLQKNTFGTSSNRLNETTTVNIPTKQIPDLLATEAEKFISAHKNNTDEKVVFVDLPVLKIASHEEVKRAQEEPIFRTHIVNGAESNNIELLLEKRRIVTAEVTLTDKQPKHNSEDSVVNKLATTKVIAHESIPLTQRYEETDLYTRYPTYTPVNHEVTVIYEANKDSLYNPIKTSTKTQLRDNLNAVIDGFLRIFHNLSQNNTTKADATTFHENKTVLEGVIPNTDKNMNRSLTGKSEINVNDKLNPVTSKTLQNSSQKVLIQKVLPKDKLDVVEIAEKPDTLSISSTAFTTETTKSVHTVSRSQIDNAQATVLKSNIASSNLTVLKHLNETKYILNQTRIKTNTSKENIANVTNTADINNNLHFVGPEIKNTSIVKSNSTFSGNTSFDCTNKIRGRYPDNHDCRRFYICIDKQTILGYCPYNTVFSKIKKQCTKNLSHCFNRSDFQCQTPGRFSDNLSENVYYICVQNGQGFVRFKFQCQKGFFLNKETVKCEPNVEILSLSQSVSSDNASKKDSYQAGDEKKLKDKKYLSSTSEKDTENSEAEEALERIQESHAKKRSNKMEEIKKYRNDASERKKSTRCVEEGKFPHHSDCRKYYVCYKNKKSVLRRKRSKCDSDEVFNSDKKKCVDADSYECQL